MEFSRQGYWSGLPFPSPGDLPNPGIKPGSLTLQADALLSEPPGKPNIRSPKAYPLYHGITLRNKVMHLKRKKKVPTLDLWFLSLLGWRKILFWPGIIQNKDTNHH